MRRSDIWFFGVILLMMVVAGFIIVGIFNIPLEYLDFLPTVMILLLSPYIVIKLFFRNSKIFKWLNTDINIIKTNNKDDENN